MNNNKLLNNDEYLHTYLNMIACTKHTSNKIDYWT